MWADDVVGTLDQQLSQVSVAGLRDSKLRVAIAGLAASGAQPEITAHIATSLEALLVAQSQHVGQRGEVPYPIDLDERLGLRIVGLG